jgi:uncharacterized membrane protein
MPSILAPYPPSPLARMNRTAYSLTCAFAIACFTLTLGTDVLYWQTSNLMWLEFSTWLLLVGMVTGVAALPFGAIEFFRHEEIRTQGSTWAHAIGRIVVLILAFLNNLVHAADGWTAVVPYGLILSALTVLLMVAMAWLGASLLHRNSAGVRPYD